MEEPAGAKKRDGIRPRKERERERTDLEVGEPENAEERKRERESRDGSWRVYESGNERHTEGKGKNAKGARKRARECATEETADNRVRKRERRR